MAQANMVGEAYKPSSPAQALSEIKDIAETIPVETIKAAATQGGGRVKPFDSLARETLLFVNGRYGRYGDPAAVYLALMISPSAPWAELVEIREPDIRTQLGLLKTQRFISLADLEATKFMDRVEPLLQKQQEDSHSLNTEQKAWVELFNEYSVLRSVVTGEHLTMAMDFSHLFKDQPVTVDQTKAKISDYLTVVRKTPQQSEAAARDLVQFSKSQRTPDIFEHYLGKLELEVFYNKAQIFLWAAILYLLLAGVLLYPESRKKVSKKTGVILFLIPLAIQITGIALRVYITRFAPVTNMYGTMIWVALGVNVFSLFLYSLYGNALISGFMLMTSGVILFLAQGFPLILSPDLDPIVAVLRNNFWLSTHVTTITISYAAFSIAMILGNATLIRLLLNYDTKTFVQEFEKHAYRAVQLGCFLLTVGIILGGVWADYSWGRFWGWDPKETWALIADLSFIALMHARYLGWARGFTFLAFTPVAYLMVLMAWYGVNFILAAGLHSYGFSSGGAAAVAIFVAIQLCVLAAALWKHSWPIKI
jgi:ABC-type transport system involved in cytochrome c biogenesis permease subunit